MADPASIRYKNPGAMWGGKVATKYGATQAVALNDGLGQGNNIADFPDFISGAAAQFYLWDHGYTNMTLAAAITKWSGGNSSTAYMAFLTGKTGIAPGDIITPELLSGPVGLSLMKAQAQWEAGKVYPMDDADWAAAQRRVFTATATAMRVSLPPATPKGTPPMTTTTPAPTPAAGPGAMATIAAVATKTESIVEDVMKVEPTVAMFVPGSSVWQPFVLMAIPFIERALKDISAQNGGDILNAVIELIQHVSPNQPNSTVLSTPAPSASTQASG